MEGGQRHHPHQIRIWSEVLRFFLRFIERVYASCNLRLQLITTQANHARHSQLIEIVVGIALRNPHLPADGDGRL